MPETDLFEQLTNRAANDSAVIARLRRSAAYEPGLDPGVFPYIEPHVHGLSEWRRTATYLAAACWALAVRPKHAEHKGPLPLPKALRLLQTRNDNTSKSLEARFQALLDADTDELQWRLRHLIQQLAAAELPIDWPSLLTDLRNWPDPRRRVQIRWARQFWAPPSDSKVNTEPDHTQSKPG